MLVVVVLVRIALGVSEQGDFHIYQAAVQAWWSKSSPYGPGIHGFLYLPSSILLFTPFALLGPVLGGIAWCLLSAGLYASGLGRLSWHLSPKHSWLVSGVALVAVWFGMKTNLSDGQMQIVMTGLLMHAASDFAVKKWLRSSAALVLAMAFKPVAAPVLGLALLVYPPLRKWVGLFLLIAFLVPFVGRDPAYVAGMYRAALLKMIVAASPAPGEWPWLSEFFTLLDAIHLHLDVLTQAVLRGVVAFIFAGLAIRARNSNVSSICSVVLALGLIYLTLFNPRNESDSYVALIPAVGISAGLSLSNDWRGRLGWVLLGIGLALGIPWAHTIDAWLKPALATIYLAVTAGPVILRRQVSWLGGPEPVPNDD